MKRIKFILVALLFVGALLQSCTGDIEDLVDPRDAITKQFRVTETNVKADTERSYNDEIIKDNNDKTVVIFTNFHDEDLRVKATLTGTVLTINKQTINEVEVEGAGTVKNLKDVHLSYTVYDGTSSNPVAFTAVYGEHQVSKKAKDENIQ